MAPPARGRAPIVRPALPNVRRGRKTRQRRGIARDDERTRGEVVAMSQDVPRIAVTGATGHVGGLVARALAAAGTPQRLVVRSASRAPALPGATAVEATYGDGDAARAALD